MAILLNLVKSTFDFLLLAKVDGVISRQNTTYRASISAAGRLSIALGFLKVGQLCVTEMLHCDWSVAGRLMRQMSLTRTHHATVVGPIRFSNRSNNCRVCKINGRRSSLVRTHHATIVFSSSLRPTEDKNRMVCAGLKTPSDWPWSRIVLVFKDQGDILEGNND